MYIKLDYYEIIKISDIIITTKSSHVVSPRERIVYSFWNNDVTRVCPSRE